MRLRKIVSRGAGIAKEANGRSEERPEYDRPPVRALKTLFAFTRDLRVDDHLGLEQAAQFGDVVPVLVLDPARASRLRASPRRVGFYCAAVPPLDAAIRNRGGRLIV